VTWRVIGASTVGSSHLQYSSPCQDRCFYLTVDSADGTPFLVALASDGAGSAQHAEIGAELACDVGGQAFATAVEAVGEAGLTSDLADEVFRKVRSAISVAAETLNVTPRDLACTLLGVVIGPTKSLYFQVGDGAIVARNESGLAPVFWPESGEFANMTYFVTDIDANDHFRVELREATNEVALFSDGLQRLALVFATETAHEPFFEPMFQVLRRSTTDGTDALCAALERFLTSDSINERTDDDKTLILATRMAGAIDVAGI
jgi:hypothetical protein